MKKIITIILTTIITISISFSALAANVTVNGGTDTAEVRGTYTVPAPTKVYSVDISWEGLDFTYIAPSKGVWNPETYSYVKQEENGSWKNDNGTINITNHSNTGIIVTPVFTAKSGYESVSMTFNSSRVSVGTADTGTDGATGSPTYGKIGVKPSGHLPVGTPDNTVIGEITITISDAESN